MKRIALQVMARARGIDKAEIEMSVVTYQNRTLALIALHGCAHGLEKCLEYLFLAAGDAQGMIRIDAGKLQCSFLDIGTFERNDALEKGLINFQYP